MAVKKKNSKPKRINTNVELLVSPQQKKKILGILLMAFALIVFLSILSYSRFDEANLGSFFGDMFKIFSSDSEFVHRAASTHNWLGLFGAYISYFCINLTIGYFSIVFPIIIFIWGLAVLKDSDYKVSAYLSNFLLVVGFIIATFFGMLQNTPQPGMLTGIHELSGNIGTFLGIGLGRLLGTLGSSVFLIALLLVAILFVFDIPFDKIFTSISKFFKEGLTDPETVPAGSNLARKKSATNLKAIKKLGKRKQKKKIFSKHTLEDNLAVEENKDSETTIRIVRKDQLDDTDNSQVDPEMIVNQSKSLSKEEDKINLQQQIYEDEEKLPDQWEEDIHYKFPPLSLLELREDESVQISEDELKHNAELLKEKLKLFDIDIEDISVTPGPVVTQYEIVPAPGVKISRIVSLEHDIALALAARGIRIIAPIPGKSAIGVEIPNAKSAIVSARSVLTKLKDIKAELPIALGKTIIGDVYITDLAIMPHLLIAGSTGSGKSVGINMLINSLIYSKHPSEVKFVITDPKKIELSFYKKLNKHYLAVSPDLNEEIITNPQNALLVLKSVEIEMEHRYDKLAKAGVRNIVDYNKKVANPKIKPADTDKMKHYKLPYIVVIIDELADLMMTSGKEVEAPIARLAQLARAVGIHLVVATQRPSVNVITGVIKANFPARIAYQVATKIDSRTILDMNGAEQLLGRGDMLFLPGGLPKPIRMQNAFISTDEVEKVTNFIYTQTGFSKRYLLPSLVEKKQSAGGSLLEYDPMFEDAAKVIVRHQQGSVSLLQRRLKLGYSRAARIVDQLEEAGIVGVSEGSKAREVLVENEEQLETILRSL